MKQYRKISMLYFIDPNQKSSFVYWFKHWVAFQKVAFKYKCWRPWDIFHDILKPFMRIVLPYKYVQFIHRQTSFHHPESFLFWDYRGMVVDWECSCLTKKQCKLNAYNELITEYNYLYDKTIPILKKYKFPIDE